MMRDKREQNGMVFGFAVVIARGSEQSGTAQTALALTERTSGTTVARANGDRGYRGHGLDHPRVFISVQRRGMTATIRRDLKRRSAIEPVIGHMKADGRLDRN
jgi:IS5 family transposase